jgi:hypothetical protein
VSDIPLSGGLGESGNGWIPGATPWMTRSGGGD